MASILRVNTLTDASSNNSVALETVSQGSSKAWINFNGTWHYSNKRFFQHVSITDDWNLGVNKQMILMQICCYNND